MSVSDIQDATTATPLRNGDDLAPGASTRAARAKQALQDGARKGAEIARTRAAAASRKVSEATQERPLASVSTALAAGLLAGFALGLCAAQASTPWRSGR